MSDQGKSFSKGQMDAARRRQRERFLQTSVHRNDEIDADEPPDLNEPEAPAREADDGFYTLHPTVEGQRRLDEVQRRRRILLTNLTPEEEAAKTKPKKPFGNYDPSRAEHMLEQIVQKIQDNKYGKGMELRSRTTLDQLIDAFLRIDQSQPKAAAINKAVKTLIKVCKSYYEFDERQFLDDDTYDQVVMRWRSLGFEEPTGYVPNKNRKTGIRYPRLHNNMDKAYRIHMSDPVPVGVKESDSVEAWLIRSFKSLGISSETVFELEVSPKIDGVSGSGTVTAKGLFENPQTRGDDAEALSIRGMEDLELMDARLVKHPFGIQYEIFVTDKDRLTASALLDKEPPYVSCRHAASGIVNQLCTGDNGELLHCCSLYPIEADGLDELSYRDRMIYLDNLAFVPKDMLHRKILKGNMKRILQDLKELFPKWEKDRENRSFTYDGMVLTFVDDDYQRVLGRQGRTNLYQMALKFNPASAVGRVAGIHLDFGKKGYRTLQVDLEHPVFLDGVRYDHIPVLSVNLFKELHLRLGDNVRVNRVGDVIPSITVEKSNHGKEIQLPLVCPDCGSLLQLRNGKLYCGNPQCAGNLSGRIEFFLKALGIDRYGENFADTLIETFSTRVFSKDGKTIRHGMRGLRHLFELTPEAFEAKGITTKDAKLFLDRLLTAMRNTPDYEILGALGIPDVGRARAYDLLKTYGTWDTFMKDFNRSSSIGTLKSALGDGIGEKVYEALNIKEGWEELQKDITGIYPYVTNTTDFSTKRTRLGHTGIKKFPPDIVKIINERNFVVVDGKNFDILIAADLDSTSAKMQTAKKKHLPVMTPDGFRERYKEGV